MSNSQAALKRAAGKLRNLSSLRPTLAMILGSGFNHVLSELAVDAEIGYGKLPGFPPGGGSGHAGWNLNPGFIWLSAGRAMRRQRKCEHFAGWEPMQWV